MVTFEPVCSRLLATKAAYLLFSSQDVPGEIVDVLVAQKGSGASKQQQLRDLLAGWFLALAYFEQAPEAAVHIMDRRLKIGTEQVLASYQGLRIPSLEENRHLLASQGPLLAVLNKLQAIMKKNGYLNKTIIMEQLPTAQYLAE